jgi:hypothetical protein
MAEATYNISEKNLLLLTKNWAEIAYVILDPSMSRTDYIKKCLTQNTVDIITRDNSIYRNCFICSTFHNNNDDGELGSFEFPLDKKDTVLRGSKLLIVFPSGSTSPIILGSLRNTNNSNQWLDNERQRKNIYDSEDCNISIIKDPTNKNLSITIFGKTDTSTMDVKINSINDNSKFNLEVGGEVNILAKKINFINEEELNIEFSDVTKQETKTTINYKLGTGLEINDEFKNNLKINNEGLKITSEKDVNIKVTGTANIDAEKINIGEATSLALNTSCPCQYTGNDHLPPIKNTKTKV